MIRFINIEDGSVFNGDKPYVHFFDSGLSTNLIHVMKLCVVTDESLLHVSIPKNEVFSLLDAERLLSQDSEIINNEEYKNLWEEGNIRNEIDINIIEVDQTWRVGMIYIIARSSMEGELHESLFINNIEYEIGGDFYNEDERLSVELINKGKDINKGIQKAVYEMSVHEDANNNILLNRKFKELLGEYMDILGEKGDYNSMEKSLKWFEWGERLKMWEFWKIKEVRKEILRGEEVKQLVDDRIKALLLQSHKTTYIGISCGLHKIMETPEGEYLYDEDLNPILEKKVFMWDIIDLSLKMSLLGLFYKTYFLPIHVDELHCTIESIIMARPYLSLSGTLLRRMDHMDHINSFRCNVKNGDKFYMGNVKGRVYGDTGFGVEWKINEQTGEMETVDRVDKSKVKDKEWMKIFGIDERDRDDYEFKGEDDLKNFSYQYFSGIGTIVPFHLEFPYLNRGSSLHKGTIVVRHGVHYLIFKNENLKLIDKTLDFKLLFEEEGEYNLYLKFESDDGVEYIKKIQINVEDEVQQMVRMYKLQKKTKEEIMRDFPHGKDTVEGTIVYEASRLGFMILGKAALGYEESHEESLIVSHNYSLESREGWPVTEYDLTDYMMSMAPSPQIIRYKQFLSINSQNLVNKLSTNTMIIIKGKEVGNQWEFYFKLNDYVYTFYTSDLSQMEDNIKTLKEAFPTYLWLVQWRYETLNSDSKRIPYIVGIDCEFTYGDEWIEVERRKIKVRKGGKEREGMFIYSYNIKNGSSRVEWEGEGKVEYINDGGNWVEVPEDEIITESKYIKDGKVDIRIRWEDGVKRNLIVEIPEVWNIKEDENGWKGMEVGRDVDRIKKVSCWKNTGGVKEKVGEIWKREVFMPFFYKPVLCEDDILREDDIVCFLPDLRKVKKGLRVEDIGWEFKNMSYMEDIVPVPFRNKDEEESLQILQPFFGQYTIGKLPRKGYYDIKLTYSLSSPYGKTNTYISHSQFLLK